MRPFPILRSPNRIIAGPESWMRVELFTVLQQESGALAYVCNGWKADAPEFRVRCNFAVRRRLGRSLGCVSFHYVTGVYPHAGTRLLSPTEDPHYVIEIDGQSFTVDARAGRKLVVQVRKQRRP